MNNINSKKIMPFFERINSISLKDRIFKWEEVLSLSKDAYDEFKFFEHNYYNNLKESLKLTDNIHSKKLTQLFEKVNCISLKDRIFNWDSFLELSKYSYESINFFEQNYYHFNKEKISPNIIKEDKKEINNLIEENKLKYNTNQLEKEICKINEEKKQLSNLLLEKEKIIGKMSNEINQFKNDLEKKILIQKEEKDKLIEHYSKLNSNIQYLERNNKDLYLKASEYSDLSELYLDQNKKLKEEIEKLKNEKENIIDPINRKYDKKELDILESNILESISNLSILEEDKNKLNKYYAKLKNNILLLEFKNTSLRTKLIEKSNLSNPYSCEIEELKNENKKLSNLILEYEKKINYLSKEISDSKKLFHEKTNKLENVIINLNLENKTLKSEIIDSFNETEKVQQEKNQLSSLIFEYENKINNLSKELSNSKYLIEEISKKFSKENNLVILEEKKVIDIDNVYEKIDITDNLENFSFEENNKEYSLEEEGTGSQNRERLNLSEQEVYDLNKIWTPNTNFISVQQCFNETTRLYLFLIEEIRKFFIERKTSLEKKIEIIAKKNFLQYHDYSYWEYRIRTDLFKVSESIVGNTYKYNTKIDISNYSHNFNLLDKHLFQYIEKKIDTYKIKISKATFETEVELNSISKNRWKIYIEEIENNINKDNLDKTISKIETLISENNDNTNLFNIFYSGFQIMSKYDSKQSLVYYSQYVLSLKNQNKKYKNIPTEIKKFIFKKNDDFNKFNNILERFLENKSKEFLKTSLNGLFNSNNKKRVVLNRYSINETIESHINTLDKLNSILSDEDTINTLNTEKIEIKNIENNKNNESIFSDIEKDLIKLILEKKELLDEEVSNFASKHNKFKNQLINSINELAFDIFDDNIIEEEENIYKISEYYIDKVITLI